MGQDQFRSIETQGYTSGKSVIMDIKEHKILLPSLSPYIGNKLILSFLTAPIVRAIASPSDGSGST